MSIEVIAEGLQFPEGPVAMPDGSVIFLEIMTARLLRAWNGKIETIAQMTGAPAGAALGPDGAMYIANVGGMDIEGSPLSEIEDGRIERVDLRTGKVERLYDRCGEHKLSAPDDLVFDAHGGLWFTDIGKDFRRHREYGGLYYAKADGSLIVEGRYPAHTLNGVGLSPDGNTLYTSSTSTARVWRIAIEAPGRLVPFTDPMAGSGVGVIGDLLATVPGVCGLDSLAMTASGAVCVATLNRGGITVVRPDGAMEHVPLPDKFTTNIAFGGKDMRDAFITQSFSGTVIRTRWSEPGLKLNYNPY
jgi:gluconolactonase